MDYPKQIMKLSELKAMGFPEEWLLRIYRSRGQQVAWKMSAKQNAPILFDTEALERVRKIHCRTSQEW